jgi:hypothetical protein
MQQGGAFLHLVPPSDWQAVEAAQGRDVILRSLKKLSMGAKGAQPDVTGTLANICPGVMLTRGPGPGVGST